MLCFGGAVDGGANVLAPGATLAPYVFESCLRLSQVSLPQVMTRPKLPPLPPPYRGIPQGCFHSSGITSLLLPTEVNYIGPRACEDCRQLFRVDLSITMLKVISKHTFSHCVSLTHIQLPSTCRRYMREFLRSAPPLQVLTFPQRSGILRTKPFLTVVNCCGLIFGKATGHLDKALRGK